MQPSFEYTTCSQHYIAGDVLAPQFKSATVSLTTNSSTCVQMTWEPPQYLGGIITGYEVCRRRLNQKHCIPIFRSFYIFMSKNDKRAFWWSFIKTTIPVQLALQCRKVMEHNKPVIVSAYYRWDVIQDFGGPLNPMWEV